LRNIAIHPDTIIEENTFKDCHAVNWISKNCLIQRKDFRALKHRFCNLPIHELIYDQSHHSVSVDQLNEATALRKRVLGSNVNPTGNLRDSLGMTPLHIMACSTVQNIDLYKVLVTKYPDNLTTRDRWGDVPLLYAIWGNAPDEIIQYLVESYQSIHPNFEFDWMNMLRALVSADVQKGVIKNLFSVQRDSFPHQCIDW